MVWVGFGRVDGNSDDIANSAQFQLKLKLELSLSIRENKEKYIERERTIGEKEIDEDSVRMSGYDIKIKYVVNPISHGV